MNSLAQVINLPPIDGGAPTQLRGPVDINLFGGTLTLGSIISRIIFFVFAFAGLGLLLMLLMGGFTLLTSAGDAKKLEQGKQTLTYALVGFLIIFVSYWVVQIVGRIFGLEEIITIFTIR